MPEMWRVGSITFSEILESVDRGKFGLPRFQRPAVWSTPQWTPFVVTVLRDRPTGTLLFLDVDHDQADFAPRQIEGAPELDSAGLKTLLLDGQQRVTTLYRLCRTGFQTGKSPAIKQFVLDVDRVRNDGVLNEEHLELKGKDQIPGFADCARQGLVSLETLARIEDFENWKSAYCDARSITPGDLRSEMNKIAPRFNEFSRYEFPFMEMAAHIDVDVIVDVFEGINRRGQKLSPFDLMVARLYKPMPDGSFFDLRNEWSDALESSPNLEAIKFKKDDDGMMPLQLIALQVSRLDEDRPKNVKGLKNKDVLELRSEHVIGSSKNDRFNLTLAVKALERAAKFLRESCGVVAGNLLPQKSMILPIADQFMQPERRRLTQEQLRRWFFCVGLSGHYYGSVDTYCEDDCRDLKLWAEEGIVPRDVESITVDRVRQIDFTQEQSREGDIIGKALMAMLISAGALDWRGGNHRVEKKALEGEAVQLHHMIPERLLKALLGRDGNTKPIAILAPVTAAQNARMRDHVPHQVLHELGRNAGNILNSHRVSKDLLLTGAVSEEDFKQLVGDRAARLQEFVIEQLDL